MKWEKVEQDLGTYLYRTPVFGGWLIQTVADVKTYIPDYGDRTTSFHTEEGYEWRSSITFIPDPEHQWDLTKEYGNQKRDPKGA